MTGSTTKNVILEIDLSKGFGRGLLKGITKYVKLNTNWCIYLEQPDTSKQFVARLKKYKPHGVIAYCAYKRDSELINELNIPTVTTLCKGMEEAKFSYIDGDNYAMGRMGAEYLLDKGYGFFGFCGYSDFEWSDSRAEGFQDVLNKANKSSSLYSRPKNKLLNNWQSELESMAGWIKELEKPVGIMACNDDHGRFVLDACKLADLKIPEDVGILGCDNDEIICELFSPPLSSIELTTERVGYEAAEVLDNMMKSKKTKSRVLTVSPVSVVTRQSTDVLQIADPYVREAVNYIRSNSKRLLQVAEVINNSGVSSRNLQQRFKTALGYSIHEEIKKALLDQICRMLLETNLTIWQIGDYLGYRTLTNISRFFKNRTGMTPLEYRKKYGLK